MRTQSLAQEKTAILGRVPPRTHALAISCALITAVLFFMLPEEADSVVSQRYQTLKPLKLSLPSPSETLLSIRTDTVDDTTPDTTRGWTSAEVKPGDSLFAIFNRLGLPQADLYVLLENTEAARDLERIQPGQILKVRTDTEGRLAELLLEHNPTQGLRLVRSDNRYAASQYTHETDRRIAFGEGTVTSSLYAGALEAGLSDKIIMQMAEIFGWDIDFALDLRPGDRFTVVYEEHYLDGDKIGDGTILAAEFTNRDQTYRAVRYVQPNGSTHYYTPEGRSMRQAFLRSPVDFRRISSHFQPNRWHPVLGKRRPHQGTDYAAATGTPIRASGDGKVAFIGRKGGYGNTIILQHGKRYSTLYAHMSRFQKGLRLGSRVEQGQNIGYVGMSGLATGPHLHYEFRIDGKHVNPVTVDLPGAPALEGARLTDFRQQTQGTLAKLDLYQRTRLAMGSADTLPEATP